LLLAYDVVFANSKQQTADGRTKKGF